MNNATEWLKNLWLWAAKAEPFPRGRLNGWERLGIIASAAWLLFVSAIIYIDYAEHLEPRYMTVNSVEVPYFANGEFWTWIVLNDGDNKTTGTGAFARSGMIVDPFDKETKPWERYSIRKLHFEWTRGLSVLLGPIVGGWCVVLGLVALVRWVIAGFRGKA